MSALPFAQQLLLAHEAVTRRLVRPEDLESALRAWGDGDLLGFLIDRRLLTAEQVAGLNGGESATIDPGSDTLVRGEQVATPRREIRVTRQCVPRVSWLPVTPLVVHATAT